MSFRSLRQHLQDMLDSIAAIEEFVGDMEFRTYMEDAKTRAAVERKLEIIAEAAYRLGADEERVAAGYRWKNLRGMGNILRHAYHRVKDEVLWNVIKKELPELKVLVTHAMQSLDD